MFCGLLPLSDVTDLGIARSNPKNDPSEGLVYGMEVSIFRDERTDMYVLAEPNATKRGFLITFIMRHRCPE